MNLSLSSIFAGLIASGVGLYLFRMGKKNSHLVHMLIGIALFIYPYFTHTPLGDWGVGALLCFAAYLTR